MTEINDGYLCKRCDMHPTACQCPDGPTLKQPEETRSSSRVNWPSLLNADFGDVDWTSGKLMTKGQQIALVGDGKAGKSLFSQEWAWRMSAGKPFLGDKARPAARVLYLDKENGWPDLQERFLSFGATPDTLTNLAYESFPTIPALDTQQGGAVLMAIVEDTGAELVFIDTVSRFISGAENDSDTWLSLYRCSLALLKANGIGSVRLDHFGKDKDRGSRGSSAKTQDVDHVWELVEKGDGLLQLRRTHTRTGIGEDLFTIRRLGEKIGDRWKPGATRHGIPTGNVFLGVDMDELIARIDSTGVPASAGRDKVRAACIEHGINLPGNDVLAEAIRQRKARKVPDSSRNFCPGQVNTPEDSFSVQQDQDRYGVFPGETCPGQFQDSSGQPKTGPVLSSLPLREDRSGRPDPDACPVCGWPIGSPGHEERCGDAA